MAKWRNQLKQYVPCKISCFIKQMQMKKLVDNKLPESRFLFNKYGEQLKNYFLYDANFRFDYSSTQGRVPRYIYWDRLRYNLPYHFYTDDMLFTQKGKPIKKYGILLEPETLQPKKYRSIWKDPAKFSDYDIIFTHSDKILNRLKNAKPFITGGVYIGTNYGGGEMNSNQYEKKRKNISIVSSNKQLCRLHQFRYALAKKYEHSNIVDSYGTFNGKFVKIWDSLAEYRYSFAIENCIEPYWITERICNCFASMTVPIYLGSPNIGKFFNLDGIIVISENDFEHMDTILRQCNEKDYQNRLDAIKDNFNRVQKYLCMEDWLYNHYSHILP